MWKLVIADDQGQKTVVNLVRDEYSLGRAEGHSVRLTERNISRKHATIRRSASGFRIDDHSSYNGLYVNGVRVAGRQDLAHGDLIQLGDYRIQVIDEAIDTQEQGYRLMAGDATVPASGRLPHRLVELIGPNQGAEYPLEGERFLIGRGTECEFPIDHGSVSRIHAEVRTIGPGQFEVIDKGSANGLRVNGHPLVRTILDSRDVLELGDVVLKYIPEGQVFRASPSEGVQIAAMSGAAAPPVGAPAARTSLGPIFIAAGLGALAVSALAISLMAGEAPQESSKPKELESVSTLLEKGDLIAVADELSRLGGAERDLAAYDSLEIQWAEAVLRADAKDQGDERYRKLLDMVAKRETLRAELRERASEKLGAINAEAIDLTALEAEEP